MNITDPRVRRYIYGLVLAAIPVLLLYGIIAPEGVKVWTDLAAAALGLGSAGLALPNTPNGRHEA